jgi:hypothetical protein
METYKNGYTVKEDEVLWELHEIRHELHKDLQKKPLTEINRGARDLFDRWKNQLTDTND